MTADRSIDLQSVAIATTTAAAAAAVAATTAANVAGCYIAQGNFPVTSDGSVVDQSNIFF
jgi:hypothetical protein